MDRVVDRVKCGGHGVPEATIRRRYRMGLSNFFQLYRPIATTWRMYDNSPSTGMTLIAAGNRATIEGDNRRSEKPSTLGENSGGIR